MREKAVLEAILSTAPDAIIRITRNGKILDYLGAAEAMFQYTSEDILGEPIERLMPDPHAGQHKNFVDDFLKSGDRQLPHFGRRFEAKRKDGTRFPVEIALSQIEEAGDIQFVGIIRDLSRRVADEKRIHAMQSSLQKASRKSALAELSVQMAHELNQPLAAAANYMDALELKLEGKSTFEVDDLVNLAQKAANQTRRAGEIILQLRQTLAQTETDAQSQDFHDAVARAMTALNASISADDTDIIVEHLGEDRDVSFDQVQLHQVLSNLVSNALRAVAQAEIKRLVITSEIRENEVEIRVADTGPGVPDARKRAIFDSFVTDSAKNIGLGLSIAKRIAKAHSGKIWVEDGPNGGAVFRMVLPLE